MSTTDVSQHEVRRQTFQDLLNAEDIPKEVLDTYAYISASNHKDRTKFLEIILDYSYLQLVQNSHLNKNLSEDQLTIEVVQMLKARGIDAAHDKQIGGHCDITVEAKDNYIWFGEAKIHGSYQHLQDGFDQLTTRYCTGMPSQNQGELIIYCRVGDAVGVLNKWKNLLLDNNSNIGICTKIPDQDLWFRTSHKSENTGLNVTTRHCIVPLFHKPKK